MAQEARLDMKRELKPDGSVVTNGDRIVEQFLRYELTHLVPDSKVWGEEYGHSDEGECGLWLVDPVDGTTNYSFGSPLWGVSIAFMRGKDLELGAVALPDLSEIYLSAKGEGVVCNGDPLAPIPPGPIRDEELISYSDRLRVRHGNLPGKMRHAGAFVIDGCFVAKQRYRGLIGVREKLYDIAACVLFGLELGAEIRYADGSALDLEELKKETKIAKPWIMFPRDTGFSLPPA